jgi:hypothetical protein
VCALGASAQDQASKPRKYKAKYEIKMFSEANFRSEKVAKIPTDTVLEALDEQGGYFKVRYKKKEGWVFKVEVSRYMDVPAPELVCFSNGYKIIGGVYRYFLACRNDGALSYSSTLTIRLYDKEQHILFEKTADFSDAPIPPEGGGPFYVDSKTEAETFEIVHQGGSIKKDVGDLIEVIP